MGTREDNSTELFLVLRAQSGETAAFDQLFEAIQKPLYRYITYLVSDASLAEDILQDVFLIIYRKIGWLEDAALFRPWSYRIASRECFKHLKKLRRVTMEAWKDEEMNTVAESYLEPDLDGQFVSELPTLVAKLSPESRTAIVLHYLDDFSLRETAEILGVSVGTAKSRVAYGLKILRKLMERRGGET